MVAYELFHMQTQLEICRSYFQLGVKGLGLGFRKQFDSSQVRTTSSIMISINMQTTFHHHPLPPPS